MFTCQAPHIAQVLTIVTLLSEFREANRYEDYLATLAQGLLFTGYRF